MHALCARVRRERSSLLSTTLTVSGIYNDIVDSAHKYRMRVCMYLVCVSLAMRSAYLFAPQHYAYIYIYCCTPWAPRDDDVLEWRVSTGTRSPVNHHTIYCSTYTSLAGIDGISDLIPGSALRGGQA